MRVGPEPTTLRRIKVKPLREEVWRSGVREKSQSRVRMARGQRRPEKLAGEGKGAMQAAASSLKDEEEFFGYRGESSRWLGGSNSPTPSAP